MTPLASRPVSNLLVRGFQLALRNWPLVVFAYALNLAFGLLVSIPFAGGLSPYLDHSLAAQRLAGTMDLNYLGELVLHQRESSFFHIAMHTAAWLNLLQLLLLFFFFAGTTFIYVSNEPARLSVLLRGGLAYFWRFVRAAVLAGCVAAVILGLLLSARALLLSQAAAVHVERTLFFYSAISGAVVMLAILLLRLWWDLVEIYIVRNALDGQTSVRQALLPALKLLGRHFFRIAGAFFLSGMLGLGALAVCLYIWNQLPAHQVWAACVVAQLGLFFLLASRFWQRGIEVALVLGLHAPMVALEEALPEEEVAAPVPEEVLVGEPTLRDLVLKLRTEPLAQPILEAPEVSRLDQHATKFPLGGGSSNQKPPP